MASSEGGRTAEAVESNARLLAASLASSESVTRAREQAWAMLAADEDGDFDFLTDDDEDCAVVGEDAASLAFA